MRYVLVVLAALAAVAVGGSQAAVEQSSPELIRLPDGFRPEGIAISGNTFYVGSIPTGAIYRGDLRTGRGKILFAGGAGRAAIGVDLDLPAANPFDPGRLVVAGGPTGKAFVYSARNGLPLATYELTSAATFVNDVVVTSKAAWLTDSTNQVLYRIGFGMRRGQAAVTTVPLTGDIRYVAGTNVNGIDATPDGETLILVQTNTGKLFTSNDVRRDAGDRPRRRQRPERGRDPARRPHALRRAEPRQQDRQDRAVGRSALGPDHGLHHRSGLRRADDDRRQG